MADIDPDETHDDASRKHDARDRDARSDEQRAADATHEDSGYSIEGDTPPAEGLGVGPTRHELDVDHPGDSAKGKIALAVILGVVVLFAVLWFVGAVVGLF